MSIKGFDKNSLADLIGQVVSTATPIQSIERLKGREKELQRIERALCVPGVNVFIYGDRGVGKSSLGATAAYQYQSAEASPMMVTGSQNDTFNSIIAKIASQALGPVRAHETRHHKQIGFEWCGLKWTAGKEISVKAIADQLHTVSDAVDLLSRVARVHSKRPIVLVDEFDAIASIDERNYFASLIKSMSDQHIDLKFIFTGVGHSLDALLGAHASVYRQFETFYVERLVPSCTA